MKNNKVLTAEEWIKSLYDVNSSSEVALGGKNLTDVLVKFAKLHVKAALEAAAENAEIEDSIFLNGCWACGAIGVRDNSILNAYPETNIT